MSTESSTPARGYAPRDPTRTVLYGAVLQHWRPFAAAMDDAGRGLPAHVTREFEAFLGCGIPALGFARVRCVGCALDRVVAFSCKCRGFCPSCGGRRMSQTAANLVDRVFPKVPVRQWVLTVPMRLRYRLARSGSLLREVLKEFLGAVFASLRRRARALGVRRARCGAVSVDQRWGSSLNLNVHFHSLVLDGVYSWSHSGRHPQFHPLGPPTTAEVQRVVRAIRLRIQRLLSRRGLADGDGSEGDERGPDANEEGQAQIQEASVLGRVSTGPRRGRSVERHRGAPPREAAVGSRAASSGWYNLHAGVGIPAPDRAALERLCRYIARPPLSEERLHRLPDGRYAVRLKTPYSDGTTHVLFRPHELMEKLAALVPPPRRHTIHYHGVLAPSADWRPHVIPRGEGLQTPRRPRRPRTGTGLVPGTWIPWAELLKRVFRIELFPCPRCGSRAYRVSYVLLPAPALLAFYGLPATVPTPASPRAGPDPFSDCWT